MRTPSPSPARSRDVGAAKECSPARGRTAPLGCGGARPARLGQASARMGQVRSMLMDLDITNGAEGPVLSLDELEAEHERLLADTVACELCEAFRISIAYDRDGKRARFTAEIAADTIGHLNTVVTPHVQICDVPPAGFEPAPPPPEGGALSPELRGLGNRNDLSSRNRPSPTRSVRRLRRRLELSDSVSRSCLRGCCSRRRARRRGRRRPPRRRSPGYRG